MGSAATRAAVDAAVEAIASARATRGTTWARLAELLGKPPVWTVAALQGQHPLDAAELAVIAEELGIAPEVLAPLQRHPTRGALDSSVPTDPTVYRLYEVLAVYGPAIKELIHEQFGDGIMSAINFRLDVSRRPDPGGDRVVITLDGKFLPYQW
ncbi:cyanase [Solihabitans fulvus]|uniref:Cyanate hydratase n=1 Tax=Solihabitans fulvus TaxID=1892852 RepID=A0A5B2WWX5_9PSEU|nr:cyanase [Solihabitans fulvus]KAA2255454.1 cyanase [Solihabitans fulvus]